MIILEFTEFCLKAKLRRESMISTSFFVLRKSILIFWRTSLRSMQVFGFGKGIWEIISEQQINHSMLSRNGLTD